MSEPDASSSVKGITKLDLDPDVSSSPIAVGANNPVLLAIQQTKYLASYASLAAALSAIGSSTKTSLVVSSSTAITSTTNITNNISVILQGNGVFNISSGIVLTIENGAGFQASSERLAFTGSGNVYFSNSLPISVYPEWWGAVGNGSTDDIAAFNKILTAYPPGKFIKIGLHSGKNYKCSDSWEVDNGIELNGPGEMTFAANKSGIVLHHVATKTGTNDGRTATGSTVRNVRLNGNNNSSTVVPTHTVSVSGTTVTKTAGASFSASTGYIEGNTIYIDGYNYVIDSVTNSTTLEIKPFPIVVSATHDSITVGVGDYRTWDTNGYWEGQDIIIGEFTQQIVTVSGPPFELELDSKFSGTTGTYIAYVQGLEGTNLPARPNLYHGIDLRSQCRIEGCYIYYFSGNAISAGGSNTQGISGTTPNENNSFIERNSGYTNMGSGFFSQGLNSNQINIRNCDFTDNRGYGIWEHGFLGNQYLGNHTSYNYSGSTDMVKNGVNGSTFIGEYSEGGQPPESFGQNAIKIGGDSGAGIAADNQGGYLREEAGLSYLNNLSVTLPVNAINDKAVMSGLAASNQANSMFVFGAGEEDANTNASYPATNARYPAYQLLYGIPAGGWYGLQYKTNTLGIPGVTTWTVSGSEAQEGGGILWLRNGFGVGERTLSSVPSFRSMWKWVTSIPTSGTTLAGDVFWNSTGTPIGWITTTAGTIGSGAVLTPFGASGVSTVLTATASLDFSNIVKFTTGELTVTVTGAAVGDAAHASPSTTLESGLVWSAYVSAANTVTIRVANVTSANIDPASRTWRVAVIKF